MIRDTIGRIAAVVTAIALLLPFLGERRATAYGPIQRGIDISEYETVTSWSAVSQAVDFCILRIGTTTGKNNDTFRADRCFTAYMEGAVSAGIPLGCYYYSGAGTRAGFEKNAREALALLGGRKLALPVFLDLEQSSRQMSLGMDTLTGYALSALAVIRSAGYDAGIYANRDWLTHYLDADRIREAGYTVWMAQYPSGSRAVEPADYDKSDMCHIWQYSDKGSMAGIAGDVDVDVRYDSVPEEDTELGIPYRRPSGDPLLGKGASGNAVRWLQTALDRYLGCGLAIDGKLGSATEAQIRSAQQQLGIKVDGIAGPETIGALVAALLAMQMDTTVPTETPTEPLTTEPPTEPSTEPPTTAPPTEPSTEPPTTEPPTEAPTEPPTTTPPTEALTEAPDAPAMIVPEETLQLTCGADPVSFTIQFKSIPNGSRLQYQEMYGGRIKVRSGDYVDGTLPVTVWGLAAGEERLTLYIEKDGTHLVTGEIRFLIEAPQDTVCMGDCNGDGCFDPRDIQGLQAWLLQMPAAGLTAPKNADLDQNGILDVFDLALMKRALCP
ncbi:MAG: peptidoglycan-binding protein [Oscillospiraceae bacterium]|nr:peptidoglycan-binding protein [Oscillospiraceae bacterium]